MTLVPTSSHLKHPAEQTDVGLSEFAPIEKLSHRLKCVTSPRHVFRSRPVRRRRTARTRVDRVLLHVEQRTVQLAVGQR